MKIALFVEGSENRAIRRGVLLTQMWDQLARALDLGSFSRVEPISKKHLVAMDPDLPTISGASETLDQLMVRCLAQDSFDAAVVAWDLVPAWNSRARPSHRRGPHRVAANEIVAVCMDPMYEGMLLQDEQHVLRALELARRPPAWPTRGWGDRRAVLGTSQSAVQGRQGDPRRCTQQGPVARVPAAPPPRGLRSS